MGYHHRHCCCEVIVFICHYLLTGSVTCTFSLAAPVAGARSVGPRPRAPGNVRHIGSVLVPGGHSISSGRLASLLRSDQRLHREGVRLNAHGARGSPLLCHLSRHKRARGRRRRHELARSKKSSKNTDGLKTRESTVAVPVLSVGRVVRPPAGQHRKQWEPRGAVITSPLSVRAVRTFGECQQPELRGEPEKGTCQSQRAATNHEQSQPPGTFPWSRLLRGPLVPPYVVKVELENESCPRAKEREEHLPVALRAFSHTGPTCFAYLAISSLFTVDSCDPQPDNKHFSQDLDEN